MSSQSLKFQAGDHVRFTMRFADNTTSVEFGTILDATTVQGNTPDGYYRVRTDKGVVLLLAEDDLSHG